MEQNNSDQNSQYNYKILSASEVSELKEVDGSIDPINMVEYVDDQNEIVTPLPLFVPESLETELEKEEMKSTKPHSIMQTFLKMSSVVYSMAGLGSIEESKVYKDQFAEEVASQDRGALINLVDNKMGQN